MRGKICMQRARKKDKDIGACCKGRENVRLYPSETANKRAKYVTLVSTYT